MAEAQSTNEETLTENLAFAEVLAWSATRPAWQRDALRRLVQSGILGSEEIDGTRLFYLVNSSATDKQ